jgi:hypothetical protein
LDAVLAADLDGDGDEEEEWEWEEDGEEVPEEARVEDSEEVTSRIDHSVFPFFSTFQSTSAWNRIASYASWAH